MTGASIADYVAGDSYMPKKKQQAKNIEDIVSAWRDRKPSEHVKIYGEHMHTDNQADLMNNVFTTAVDDAYNTFVQQVEKVGKKDDEKISKEDEMYQVLNAYMEAFVKKLNPKAFKLFEEEVKDGLTKESQKHEQLLTLYQNVVGQEAARDIMQYAAEIKRKGLKVRDLKTRLRESKDETAKAAMGKLNERAFTMHIDHLDPGLYQQELHKQLQSKGYDFEDAAKKAQFYTTPAQALTGFHQGLVSDALSGKAYKEIGVKKKEGKKAE
ncbi:hypothetical protein GF351_05140 [Candidatus Woesearchaeota archaeon]|nr:hypothetical protein [Candidatus Woesearchaeota archaeon]